MPASRPNSPASRFAFAAATVIVVAATLLTSGCETTTEPGGTTPDTLSPPTSDTPPAGTVYAVDVSHWSGEVSQGQAACWWDAGIRHVIAGTQDSAISAQQLAVASSLGLTVDAYVMLEWDQDVSALVERAKRIIGPYPVRRLWLDAERPADGRSPAEMVGLIQAAADACGAVACGIYTGKGWWLASTDNSTAFSHLPLWYPRWDGQADFEEWYNPVAWYEGPFGGWEDPSGKQYAASQTASGLCGVNVDYNIMDTGGPPAADLRLEAGRVRVFQIGPSQWHSVTLQQGYVQPVVIMQPPSHNGQSPTTVRLRNVTWRGFEFQLDEWDYQNGMHTVETVGYLVIEAGLHRLSDGRFLEAGTAEVGHDFATIPLAARFQAVPVILTQAQTSNEGSAVVTRQRGASTTGFEVRLQEEQAADGLHANETVGYVAAEAGAGLVEGVAFEAFHLPQPLSEAWTNVAFSTSYEGPVLLAGIQTFDDGDPAGLRYRRLGPEGVEVRIQEEMSADAEVEHGDELVGYLVFEYGGETGDDEYELPPEPSGLSPAGGVQITTSSVTLSCHPISGALRYDFDIEYQRSGSWSDYHTYRTSENFKTFWPYVDSTGYRWRVRAQNQFGWGEWSVWAYFYFSEL